MKFFKNSKKYLPYHAFGWVTFIIYEVTFVKLIRWTSADIPVWSGYVLPYLINIAFFYFHAFVTLHKGIGKKPKNVAIFIFFLLLEFLVYLFLMGARGGTLSDFNENILVTLYPTKIQFIQQVWRGLYFLIFSTAYWLIQKSFQSERKLKEAENKVLLRQQEKKELELRLLSSQNAFLQAQINPHLLFNTLSFIHSEVQQASTKASDAIIILSEMMRYSFSEIKADGKVPVEKEIEQISNLVKINQLRFSDKIYINLIIKETENPNRIIPLLLLPLVENLFKYGNVSDKSNPAQVHIKFDENILYFETYNAKKEIRFITSGIGIENVRKRLNSYYADKYSLDIVDSQFAFSLTLKIEL